MIALGAQRLPGRRAERRVVLSVAPSFAQLFLVPRLPRFRALHPGIRISIDTSHRQALFPMEGVDLSIRMGKGAWPGVKSDLMFRERLGSGGIANLLGVRVPQRLDRLAEGDVSAGVVVRIRLDCVDRRRCG